MLHELATRIITQRPENNRMETTGSDRQVEPSEFQFMIVH
jgi:hypothetical protein